MTELDQIWSEMIGSATAEASRRGRSDVLDYLMLRASNDQIRAAGVSWLFETATGIITSEMRSRPHLIAESIEPNSFRHGNSNLVGRAVNFRHGVRCLSLEAGWTRTPADGIMRGGALATARISHFGVPRETQVFRLVLAEPSPLWFDAETSSTIGISDIARHIDLLLNG